MSLSFLLLYSQDPCTKDLARSSFPFRTGSWGGCRGKQGDVLNVQLKLQILSEPLKEA